MPRKARRLPHPTAPAAAIEFTVQPNGQVRQAGATTPEGKFVLDFKATAERDLFVFAQGVMGLDRLQNPLHKALCDHLTTIPAYRKLTLIPRDHLKTSVARAMVAHMIIQPKENNIYRPGHDGRNTRILNGTETVNLATLQLRWLQGQFEKNSLLRALWPHAVWQRQREAKRWNETEMLLPRSADFPEPTVMVAGVGTAITGRHFNVHVFDDLVTLEASRSEAKMFEAISWFKASRALMDDVDTSLEYTFGTRWAVFDLYAEILEHDHSVEPMIRSAVEDGRIIFPRPPGADWGFTHKSLSQLARELQGLFFLLYMNSPDNAQLTSFNTKDVRRFRFSRGFPRNGNQAALVFGDDARDALLDDTSLMAPIDADVATGVPLTRETYDLTLGRIQHLRAVRAT